MRSKSASNNRLKLITPPTPPLIHRNTFCGQQVFFSTTFQPNCKYLNILSIRTKKFFQKIVCLTDDFQDFVNNPFEFCEDMRARRAGRGLPANTHQASCRQGCWGSRDARSGIAGSEMSRRPVPDCRFLLYKTGACYGPLSLDGFAYRIP